MPRYLIGFITVLTTVLFVSGGCTQTYTPKPRGYFRIDLPEKNYSSFDSAFPYQLDYPDYAVINPDKSSSEPYWINVVFPQFKAKIHITYKPVKNNLYEILEDNIKLAYSHVVKADAIEDFVFTNEENNVYGMVFQIKGDAASPVQFFATDSVNHFLRGALYFQSRPNKDSLAPVVNFITTDIFHLMESIRWKSN